MRYNRTKRKSEEKMANIEDYLKWRGDLSFKVNPFNEVDNLILSELAYLNLEGIADKKIKMKDAIEGYFKKYTEKEILKEFALSTNPINFYRQLQNSTRFGNLNIIKFVNEMSKSESKQFSALIVEMDLNTIYIAFKGTDKYLIGWKEDFNLSYMDAVPSQISALSFINDHVKFKHRKIYIGGHSKGGNLAVYAATFCKKNIQKRIKAVYNNDGPGFLDEFIALPNYQTILPKITTILPETSIIGMLLTHKGQYKVVKSNTVGIWQHDALSWQVNKDHFITIEKVDETSNKIQQTIADWLQKIGKKEREEFINTLFDLLDKNKIETVEDLIKLKLRKIPGLLKEFTKLNEKQRKLMMDLLKDLMTEASKHFERKSILHPLKYLNRRD